MTYNIKHLREQAGLTQQAIASELGMPLITYRYYETGKRDPSIDVLTKLADYYNVSVDYLLGYNPADANIDALSINEKSIVRMYRELSADDQRKIYDYVSMIYSDHKNKAILDFFDKLPPEEKEKVVQMIRQMYPE